MRWTTLVFICFSFVCMSQEIDQIILNRSTRMKIRKLAKCEMVYGRSVGYGGTTIKEFKVFESFVKTATIDEKIKLLKHSSPVIRAYSYWAILLTDKNLASKYISLFEKDEEIFNSNLYGCVPQPFSVSGFVKYMSSISDEEMAIYF